MTSFSEKNLPLFYEHPSPMIIYEVETLRIMEANMAAVKIYGYTLEEFRGLSIKEIRPKEEVPNLMEVMKDIRKSEVEDFGIYKHQTKGGQILHMHILSRKIKFKGKEARLTYLNDVTDTIEANKKLTTAYGELEHHVNHMPLAMVKIDRKTQIIEWSDQAEDMSGYKREEILSQPLFSLEMFKNTDTSIIKKRLIKFEKGLLENDQLETRITRKNGELIHVRLHTSSMKDDSGKLKSILAFVEDITEEKEAEMRLRRKNELIEFIQKLSHRLQRINSYHKALHHTLKKICEFLGWPFGHVYIKNQEGLFESKNIFYQTDENYFEPFRKETQKFRFVEDKGFIGKVISEKKPKMLYDLPESDLYIRQSSYPGLELYAAVGIPVFDSNEEVIMVLEFYNDNPVCIDKSELGYFATLANHLGVVLEQIQIREELEHSEHKFRRIFEGANDGIFIMKGRKFVDCNSQVTEMFNVEKDEILGKTPFDFSPEYQPNGRRSEEYGVELLKKVIHENKPQRFEWRQFKKTGELFDVEVSLNKLEIYDGYYVQAIVRDITEQRKAQLELKKREQLFRSLFLQAPAAIVMVDSENRIQMVNGSFVNLFGYSEEELIGNDLDRIIVPKEEYHNVPKMPAVDFKQGSFYHETRRITKSGKAIDVFVGSIPVYLDDEPLAGFGMYIDITEQKEIQKRLSNSLEEKKILLAEIHHRVKNNLAIISGLLELKAMNLDDVEIQNAFQESQLRIHTMALIHEKLYRTDNFSRLKFVNYIRELVSAISSTLRYSEKEIQLEITGDEVELNVNQAIPAALIINELVSNALEHAFDNGQNGVVKIHIQQQEQQLSILIEDNGKGLPDDFEEVRESSLGMTLVERLTDQLDGSLHIKSDEGTSCELVFKKTEKPGSSENRTVPMQ